MVVATAPAIAAIMAAVPAVRTAVMVGGLAVVRLTADVAAARNFEHPQVTEQIAAEPRLVEVLLFLQFVSQPENYAGGLKKFTADFIADSFDMIGTPAMRSIGERKLSREQAREIYRELPGWAKSEVGGYPKYTGKPYADADADGLPDSWERRHGLNMKDASDASADADKDGYTNVEEFLNGTDPKKFVDYTKVENNVDKLK